MAVTYRSSGTIVANGDAGVDMSSSLPSGLSIDDIMIFDGGDTDNEHFDAAMPDGWVSFASDNSNGNLGGTVAWKRYDGTETDWQFDTPSNAGQLVMGVIHAFQGAIKTGNPITNINQSSVAQRTGHLATVVSSVSGLLAVGIFLIEDNVSATKSDQVGTWTERDNQTTTVGSDGRLICTTSLSTGTIISRYITGNEYSFNIGFEIIPETDRPTIVPNTADAHDFGADNTPTLEFTGSDANDDDLEYEFEILSAIDVDCDKYIESNQDSGHNLNSTNHGASQSFTGNGGKLSKATFYLKKTSSPTGFARAILYAHSGTFGSTSIPTGSALAISDTALDISTLTTSYVLTDFNFGKDFTLVNGTKYCIVIQTSIGTDSVQIGYDTSSPTHAGSFASFNGTVWSDNNTADLIFYIETHTVELNKLSVTPDATFTNTTDGGDTHPFDEGDKADFTVTDELFETYDETNESNGIALSSANFDGSAQSFTGVAGDINHVKLFMFKVNSPTGDVVAKIYAHSGTFGTSSIPTGSALATSNNVDVTTIPLSPPEWVTFIFPTPFTMTGGTKYVLAIEYSGGDGGNNIQTRTDVSSPTHEGNAATLTTSTWTDVSGTDLLFELYILKTLADATWFWRARAIDTGGTNQWSDWTTIRSFDIMQVADPPRGNKLRSFLTS